GSLADVLIASARATTNSAPFSLWASGQTGNRGTSPAGLPFAGSSTTGEPAATSSAAALTQKAASGHGSGGGSSTAASLPCRRRRKPPLPATTPISGGSRPL